MRNNDSKARYPSAINLNITISLSDYIPVFFKSFLTLYIALAAVQYWVQKGGRASSLVAVAFYNKTRVLATHST